MSDRKISSRNRSVRITPDEEKRFLEKCIFPDGKLLDAGEIKCRTICGDIFQVSPLLPRRFADLIIADPPYNMTKKFNGKVFSRKSMAEYEEYTARWLSAVEPLLKSDGSIYVCCDWESSLIVGKVVGDFFHLRNRITWGREKGRGAAANWKNSMEDIYFATAGKEYTFNLDAVKLRRRVVAPYRADDGKPKDWQNTGDGKFRDSCPGNFWDDITVPFWSMPENTDHPTQKPEKLLAKLILASSRSGDMVFDPFGGSGSTAVSAKKLGRNYCSVELEPRYCACAEKRLLMAETDREIQGFAEGVFWERNSAPVKK
ncbi:MAG: site-specific DNA-methyltransferase [Lentisphaerae bacterium]|nr:site-specific DNA-methyltransferase [Lentisphaerota bacterium]